MTTPSPSFPLLRVVVAVLLGAPCALRAQEVGVPSVATDGYERRDGFDVLNYDLALELPASPGPITARARILVERLRAGPDTLRLDFGPLQVDHVSVDGAQAGFRHEAGVLAVALPAAPAGARQGIEVAYHGGPRDGLIQRANRHGEPSVFADNWPDRAREWFPAVDHPSDKATVAFDVTAPAAWRVVANGYLLDRTDLGDGRTRTRWVETAEVPTYVMVIGAASFAVADAGRAAGVEVSHWTFRADSAAGAAAFARSGEMLAFYDSLFGPYPYEKLAHVQSTTRYGAMENSSAIFYGERPIGDALEIGAGGEGEARDGITSSVAHETVHQWFGDAVTEKDWHHVWLSEGFATYFGAVFFEFHGSSRGRGHAELARRMRAMSEQVLAWDREANLAIVDPHFAVGGDYDRLLHTGNYQKGAWVLHMLRHELGDTAFFEGIRRTYAALRGGNAWSADVERFMEETSGKELGWFFAQWLGRPGHPVLEAVTEPGSRGTRIVVRQVQPEAPWRIAVDVEIIGSNGPRRERIEMTGRESAIEVASPAVDRVVLDPDGWLLFEPASSAR